MACDKQPSFGSLLEQLIMARYAMRIDLGKRVLEQVEYLQSSVDTVNDDNQRLLRKIEAYQERVKHLEQDSATTHAALEAQVAELTRERDSWRRTAETLTRERNEARADKTQLAEAHDMWKGQWREAADEVTRLTHELKAAQRKVEHYQNRGQLAAAESEVTRLTEALAAAERRTRTELARVDAAESECAALRVIRAQLLEERDAAEARLAAANALLKDACPATHDGPRCQEWYHQRDAHLAAQPATAPADEGCECPGAHECGVTTSTAANERKARTDAEQAVLGACAEIPSATLRLVQGRMRHVARAELARREPKRG